MEQKEDLLALSKLVEQTIYKATIKILKKENVSDCLKYLSDEENLSSCLQTIQKAVPKTNVNKEELAKNKMKIVVKILKQLKDHDIKNKNYCEDLYEEFRKDLMKKIQKIDKIVELLKFLMQLTALDEQFIQCGSNALYLLVQMKNQNTSLIGANFVKCNFSGSEFENVDIGGVNLNGALLLNYKWKGIKIQELNKIDGQNKYVYSVCFSPDGTSSASCSYGNSIRLWDVKTGKSKVKFIYNETVCSLCFSPDGTTLASGSKSIRLWDVKTEQQKAKFDGHSGTVYSVCFSPDGNTLASGSWDNSIRLCNVKTGKQKDKLDGHTRYVYSVCFSPDGTTLISGSYDKFVYGMLKQDNKKPN
ncbi:unnamed protein product [Paramecium sonneborni]|uniref:Uncharacterized protein n=1 Tax=Paramecium sonneborni TaxID=65129 RepID=A0A8S1R5W7_9CILI|nr:unnamed protein product [Paramecium sonneborni]